MIFEYMFFRQLISSALFLNCCWTVVGERNKKNIALLLLGIWNHKNIKSSHIVQLHLKIELQVPCHNSLKGLVAPHT